MLVIGVSPITCFDGGGQCLVPPVVTQNPSNIVAANGDTVALTVQATGTGPLTYQWYFNATNLLAGATNATLVLSPVVLAEAGRYAVVVSNVYGSVTSALASVVVIGPPTLIGWFRVGDGPAWGTAPPCYSAREAAALLFGGALCQYHLNRPKQFESHGLGGWLGGYNLPEHPRVRGLQERRAIYQLGKLLCLRGQSPLLQPEQD